VASDAEAEAYLEAEMPGARTPSADEIDAARWNMTRLKRSARTMQLVETLRAKAAIQPYFEPGCLTVEPRPAR
jgi:hypothetical protein